MNRLFIYWFKNHSAHSTEIETEPQSYNL